MAGLYEYKVIPAPTKGKRAKGAKGSEGRFSNTVTELLNDMASQGWEFQRAESLPSIERVGLTKTETQHHNMLVFRRPHPDYVAPAMAPVVAPAVSPVTAPVPAPAPSEKPDIRPAADPVADPAPQPAVAQSDQPRFSGKSYSDTAPEDTSPPLTSAAPKPVETSDLPGILKDRGKHLRDS